MTEREIFLNMIRRVVETVSTEKDFKNFFREEGDGNITIFNGNCVETTFEFDKNGSLTFFL